MNQAITEEELVALACAGDREAMGELCLRARPRCLYAALSLLRHREDAEDAVQNALLRAWRHLDQYLGAGPFAAWLIAIVMNECRMTLRRQKQVQFVYFDKRPEDGEKRKRPPEIPVAPEADRWPVRLAEELRRLPPLFRGVLELRLEGLADHEAAMRLGISTGALKSRAYRARAELRTRLGC